MLRRDSDTLARVLSGEFALEAVFRKEVRLADRTFSAGDPVPKDLEQRTLSGLVRWSKVTLLAVPVSAAAVVPVESPEGLFASPPGSLAELRARLESRERNPVSDFDALFRDAGELQQPELVAKWHLNYGDAKALRVAAGAA